MKTELLEKLEALAQHEAPLKVLKEFNTLSAQLRSLITIPSITDKEAAEDKTKTEASAEVQSSGHPSVEAQDNTEVKPAQEEPEIADKPEQKAPLSSEKGNDGDALSASPHHSDEEEDVDDQEDNDSKERDDNDADATLAKLKEVTAAFREKLSLARLELKRVEVETVATAKDLLTEMQELVENEENIGKAFAGFNAIQEKWKSLPKVGNDNYRDLNAEYNKQIERFFYNINIYKELKELDLKRNLEEKLKVLEDQRKLIDANDMRLLEVEVRLNQDRWNEIGPTFKEEWGKLKDEFWAITRTIYNKVQDFYNQRKEEQDRNFEEKKVLLEKVKHLVDLDLRATKKWQEKTAEIIALQNQWKLIGFVPKEQIAVVWKEFRATCDTFFEHKRAYFNQKHEEQETHKNHKLQLLEEAETWKENTDWKAGTEKFISLQKKWKETGAAHQRDENKLWRKFRAACDHFFQARNAGKDKDQAEEAENLVAKTKLLEEIEAFVPDPAQSTEGVKTLKTFSDRYREIGHVPFRDKDKINKAYRNLLDEKFSLLKVDRKVKEKIRFEEKIDLLKSSDAKERLVQKEKDFLRNKISKLESEINQYENNLGFFANSKGADKLKAEVVKKIDMAKAEVDAIYDQIGILDEV